MKKKSFLQTALPIIGPLLIMPLGFCLGTFFGLISDFGISHTTENIKLNPEIFAKQYAFGVVLSAWAAVVTVGVSVVIVVVELIRRSCHKDESRKATRET
jgi:hypothetical protein